MLQLLCDVVRAPSYPEIPDILKLSWNQKLSWNFSHLVRMFWYDLCYAIVTALPLFCTWLPHNWTLYIANVECPVLFSIVTVHRFMCNIALVTCLWLQYWSAWLIKICEHRKTCIFCVLNLVKPTKMSWNLLKIWSWNFTSCSWEPWYLPAYSSSHCSQR